MSGISDFLPTDQLRDGRYSLKSTGNQDTDATLIGSKWVSSDLTYSFPTTATPYLQNGPYQGSDGNEPNGLLAFNAQQQQMVKYALSLIQGYTNLKFTEVPEVQAAGATFRFGNTNDSSVQSAYANFPSNKNSAGDVWFGTTGQPFYLTPDVGDWGGATIMHEIGHAVGLKHGHQNYQNETSSNLVPESLAWYLNFNGILNGMPNMTAEHDGQAWSLMTYSATPTETGSFYGEGFNQPQSYMQVDIAALQYLYGANFSYNSGDTVYKWTPDNGTMYVNGEASKSPTSNIIFMTIWDGGGNDTYDLSAYKNDLSIDLRPGQFSTFSEAQLANPTELISQLDLAPGNIANAMLYNNDLRSLIENAIGGSGNDRFIGNIANNNFKGNGGNDYMDGGAGVNTSAYNGSIKDYSINRIAGTVTDNVAGRDGADTIANIEKLVFTDFVDLLSPTSNADKVIYGLYQTAFGRVADESGFTVWTNYVDNSGMSLSQVANSFVASTEFANKFGNYVSNVDFVSDVYQAAFGRSADVAGRSFWVQQLDRGLSKADLILAFASSSEEASLNSSHTDNGYWVLPDGLSSVTVVGSNGSAGPGSAPLGQNL